MSHVAGHGRDELYLGVGGLIGDDEHVTWRNLRLRVGDVVAVKIVETDQADKPGKRYRADSQEYERNSKAYVSALAKKFGWKLVTSTRKLR